MNAFGEVMPPKWTSKPSFLGFVDTSLAMREVVYLLPQAMPLALKNINPTLSVWFGKSAADFLVHKSSCRGGGEKKKRKKTHTGEY